MPRTPWLFLFILLAAAQSSAQPVFKCVIDGKSMYQNTPCDDGESKLVDSPGSRDYEVRTRRVARDKERALLEQRKIALPRGTERTLVTYQIACFDDGHDVGSPKMDECVAEREAMYARFLQHANESKEREEEEKRKQAEAATVTQSIIRDCLDMKYACDVDSFVGHLSGLKMHQVHEVLGEPVRQQRIGGLELYYYSVRIGLLDGTKSYTLQVTYDTGRPGFGRNVEEINIY